MLGKSRLTFTLDEYDEWKEKFEAGYGQLRDGVTPEEVEVERDAIPKSIRHTYIFEEFIGKGDSMEKKEVTEEHYAQVLDQHKDEVYHIALKGWQMPILHGLIALAADHPGVKKRGWPTKEFITQIRWWCREKFKEWGFTPEEVEYLDKMRQDAQGNITEE